MLVLGIVFLEFRGSISLSFVVGIVIASLGNVLINLLDPNIIDERNAHMTFTTEHLDLPTTDLHNGSDKWMRGFHDPYSFFRWT